MLEDAYSKKENDPYITDSVGWGYYLIGDYNKAEKYLKRAVELMPTIQLFTIITAMYFGN